MAKRKREMTSYHEEQRHVAVRLAPLRVLESQFGRVESMVHERGARGEQVLGVVRYAVPLGQVQTLQGVVQNVHVALHVHIQQIL